MPASKTLTGTLEFTFVDNGTDQSMYLLIGRQQVYQEDRYAFFYQGI